MTNTPIALIQDIPFYNPELSDGEQPDFAPVSLMGTCPTHGFERITRESVSGGSDPTQLQHFACGEVDILGSFGEDPFHEADYS